MSLDRSLKTASNLSQHRNVLTRPERIAKLRERGEFDVTSSRPIGLVKVANRKIGGGKKVAKKAEGDAAAAPAAGKAPAGKAPAKGGAKK